MSYVHPYGSTLPENGAIGRGYGLISDSKRVELRVTTGGNLELYLDNSRKLWSIDDKNVSFVKMQVDGNCVGYDPNYTAVWHTATNGPDRPYSLVCQNDGNLVVYDKNGKAVWHTNTAVVH